MAAEIACDDACKDFVAPLAQGRLRRSKSSLVFDPRGAISGGLSA